MATLVHRDNDADKGVPESTRQLTHAFPYNDLPALKALFETHKEKVAAVILEPIGLIPPEPGYLESVRDMAHANGALLIFDEIVTGFRIHMGGAQEYFNVIPDLACFGKAMGNGYPFPSWREAKKSCPSLTIFFSLSRSAVRHYH